MERLCVRGGNPLHGEVKISGSKNSTLPILAATLLTDEPVRLSNVPHLRDVTTMNALLGHIGSRITLDDRFVLELVAEHVTQFKAPYDLVKTMRASFLVLGPLLARFGIAEVSLPGGCAIGQRPVDQHLKALQVMGAVIEVSEGYVKASAPKGLKGARIAMDLVTVTGTQNVLMAATLADGITVIENAAREPEVVELAQLLSEMGAKIEGAGTDVIEIEGSNRLSGCEHTIFSDRIETGTYLIACAITGGSLTLLNTRADDLDVVLDKLSECGADTHVSEGSIAIDMKGRRPKAVDIRTAVYPGMPTDLQAQFMALNCVAEGSCTVTETIFENRFMHVQELVRLGADIRMASSTTARVQGVRSLRGAPVMATDLRASSSLIIAGLVAEGETVVDRIYHIDRGYERIEEKLRGIGADVERIA